MKATEARQLAKKAKENPQLQSVREKIQYFAASGGKGFTTGEVLTGSTQEALIKDGYDIRRESIMNQGGRMEPRFFISWATQ